MAKLAKSQIQPIWELLVKYANGDLGVFRDLLTVCMCWSGLAEVDCLASPHPDSSTMDILFRTGQGRVRGGVITVVFGGDGASFDLCRDVREGLALEEGARRYHQDFRRVLTWLVNNSEAAGEAFAFLWTHGRENITIEAEVNTNKDEPALYLHRPSEYGSIVSPACKFILDRIDHYNQSYEITGQDAELSPELTPHDRNYNETLRREIIPLGICATCKEFMVVERSRKRYCKDICRVRDNQAKMTKSQKATKMQEYRANKKKKRKRKFEAAQARLEALGRHPAYKSRELH